MRLSRGMSLVIASVFALSASPPASGASYLASAVPERCIFGGGYWASGSFANVAVCDRTGGDVDGTTPTSPMFAERADQWCISVYKSGSPSTYHSGCTATTPSATAFVFDPLLDHATVQFSVNSGGGILTANLSLTGSGPRRATYTVTPAGNAEDTPSIDDGFYVSQGLRRDMTVDAGSFITSTLATGGVITSGGASLEINNTTLVEAFGP